MPGDTPERGACCGSGPRLPYKDFVKGPRLPQITIYTTVACPYCLRAKSLLRKMNLAFTEIPVDDDAGAREEMSARAHGRRTVPQIFFDGVHIGDSDELHELARNGQLDLLLAGETQ